MEEVKFKQGDVVKLRSGGPTMTIEELNMTSSIEVATCTWFDKDSAVQQQDFFVSSLTPTK